MGRIIYFISPLDSSKKKIIESDKSVLEVLTEFKIEKESLSLTLNGECPDTFDINYVLQDDDLLEIRRIVHGGGSKGKSNLALVVQLVALVAVSLLTFGIGTPAALAGAAAISVAAGIASGALNARAAKLALKEAGSAKEAEFDVATNSVSLNNATNETRVLKPMALPMGSVRYAPDFHAQIFKSYALGSVFYSDYLLDDTFYPGLNPSGGAIDSMGAPTSNWEEMPANYITTGVPVYKVLLAPDPSWVGGKSGLKTAYLANPTLFKTYWNASKSKPIIVYHHDVTDPWYGIYSFFAFQAIIKLAGGGPGALTYSILTDPGYGLLGTISDASLVNLNEGSTNPNLFSFPVFGGSGYYVPGVVSGQSYTTSLNQLKSFMINVLNNGDMSPANKESSFEIPSAVVRSEWSSVNTESVEYGDHLFNYGIGDMDISEKRLEKSELSFPSQLTERLSKFDYEFHVLPAKNRLKRINDKNILNGQGNVPISPEPPINLNDHNTYNWVFLNGPVGMSSCMLHIDGTLYRAGSGGLSSNYCRVEVQSKSSTQTDWATGSYEFFENNNTKRLTKPISITAIGTLGPDDFLQIRVRKMTLDSKNNIDDRNCNLTLKNIYFYDPFTTADDFRPYNMEALELLASIEIAASSNRFSALIESYCWVFDFDTETWAWQLNRNPGFWFLYFAYGGFLNIPADGSYTYPYSPTYGWVNYPNHIDSTDKIFGVGLSNNQLDLEKILEWAEFCEDKQLYLDLVLKDDTSCADVLERIANVGRGSVSYYNGKLSVVYEDESQIPTCVFGMGNIIAGSFNVDYNVTEKVGVVRGNFTDRNLDWETRQLTADVPFSTEENLKIIEVNLEGVTEEQQAQREINIMAARQYFQRRTYSWKVDVEGLIVKRGDLVYLSHDSTQYGYSGRVRNFILAGGLITGIQTTSVLSDSTLSHVTLRFPDGTMQTFAAHVSGNDILFDEVYPLAKASVYINPTTDNLLSDYDNSIPEDFVFIGGAKATPGKLVRISEIKSDDKMNFTITAVDEDPAMWAYEYDDVVIPESFEDAQVVLSLTNVKYSNLGGGLIKINWENVNGYAIKIINEFSEMPIEADGSFTFTGGEVILELTEGLKYDLRLEPFSIGTSYKSENKRISVWA